MPHPDAARYLPLRNVRRAGALAHVPDHSKNLHVIFITSAELYAAAGTRSRTVVAAG